MADGVHALIADSAEGFADAVLRAYYDRTVWRQLRKHGRTLLETRFSASRAAVGILQVLAHLRDANTLMGMKSLALSSAPPRIYSDLRAAASLGGTCVFETRTWQSSLQKAMRQPSESRMGMLR